MEINLSVINFLQLAAVDQGVTIVPVKGMNETRLRELREDAAKREYHGAMAHTPTNVTQNFVSCGDFEEGSIWKDLAFDISQQLASEYMRAGQSRMFAEQPLLFTDLALQKYPQSAPDVQYGISPHRDQSGFVNLVAVLLISGPSSFFVCKDKSGAGASNIMARPGDLILMRGGGYGVNLPRPFHYIGKVNDPFGRLSFGLRQVTSNAEEAARIRDVFDPKKTPMQA